jgi:hypothetical protein
MGIFIIAKSQVKLINKMEGISLAAVQSKVQKKISFKTKKRLEQENEIINMINIGQHSSDGRERSMMLVHKKKMLEIMLTDGTQYTTIEIRDSHAKNQDEISHI